jgi:hypothetical protein
MYILIVIFHVNSGSSGFSQEFTSRQTCEAARMKIYGERERVRLAGLETAFCMPK